MFADDRIYLDGNSLGRLPHDSRAALHAVIDQWGSELIGGWHEWIDAPTRAGDALAEVLGARPGEVLVSDSTTVNLYKLVHAALDADPAIRRLATDPGNFPTDRYVLEGIARGPRPRIACSAEPEPARGPARGALPRRIQLRRAARPALRRAGDLGPQPLRGRAADRPARQRRSSSPSAAPTSTSTPARARPPTSTSPSTCRSGCARRSRAGSGRPTSSRWSARTSPRPGSRASSPVRRRSSPSPPSRRARS